MCRVDRRSPLVDQRVRHPRGADRALGFDRIRLPPALDELLRCQSRALRNLPAPIDDITMAALTASRLSALRRLAGRGAETAKLAFFVEVNSAILQIASPLQQQP